MNDITKSIHQFSPFQTKVFARWISNELKGIPNSNFVDLTKDLSSGVNLINLAHVLTHKKVPQNYEYRKSNYQNCELALKMLKSDGFDVSNIYAKYISENDQRYINELIWLLISHYSIERCFGNFNEAKEELTDAKSILLSWAVQKTQTFKNVFDFRPYDLAMCALLDSYYPDKINYYALNLEDHQKNFDIAIHVMKELGIPCFIYPEDLFLNNGEVDKKSLLTQLSFVRMALEKTHSKEKHQIYHSKKENFNSNFEKVNSSDVLTISDADKQNESGEEALLHAQIRAQRRARVVSRLQEHKSEDQIKKERENHERKMREEEKHKENDINREKIGKEIIDNFNENKRAYTERKIKQKNEIEKQKILDIPIEEEIVEEFKENEDEYKKRKEQKKLKE